MIEGQEKERQRLASDLHDSAGATLTSARLQFNHIKKNRNNLDDIDALFDTTETLLNQAYQEIRSMAHLKNSGVLAKNSLLPAIENLAANASIPNQLSFEVRHFGLENRLDNTLEITIFRIIQELVSNIIKHAKASQASITLTQHDTYLNLIVEDNGKGFKLEQVKGLSGLGLNSLAKRVEHLNGDLEVDSSAGQGTTILIDIPLTINN